MTTAHNTQAHLIVDPDTIDNVPALREALHAANKSLLGYALAIEERDKVGRDFVGLINRVLLQHVVGDFRGVAAILEAQLEASPRLRQSLEDVRQSKEARQLEEWKAFSRAEFGQEEMPEYNAGQHDPWAMKTIDELRVAVDVMNRAGIQISTQLATLEGVLKSMTAEVSMIVVAHVKGTGDDVIKAVGDFVANRCVVKDANASQMH
ncbi:hypothetical protein [Burkholderia multivorans]|uniref:hypothetical protein n=1 Tax=Burkholderia multivorans TaxID=87883 RepID=UPI000D005AF6|nr:hypothetical protein [Burkholderia multivorans]MBU9123430.1 hypothetical protein [Burkholderia multivorans]PRF42504.1 hypothetical protein C6Q04_29915 [Burkholderia multivorans]PRG50790.1 hypothetical protein C6T63_17820 [Burkholderia multivorans]